MKTKNKKEQSPLVAEFYPETNRPMLRPKIYYFRATLLVLAVLGADILLALGIIRIAKGFAWYSHIRIGTGWQFTILFVLLCILSLWMFAKRIVIFAIRVYQKYAPYDIRVRCLFVPSCSEYMILAIQKYGLVRGIKKGIHRLNRCYGIKVEEDYP